MHMNVLTMILKKEKCPLAIRMWFELGKENSPAKLIKLYDSLSNFLILIKRSEKRSIKCPTNSTLQVGKKSNSNSYQEKDNNHIRCQSRNRRKRSFSHDVMAAILVDQNKEMATMLADQNNLWGISFLCK